MITARFRPGAISKSSSSHLPPSVASKEAKPVMFPLGRSSRATIMSAVARHKVPAAYPQSLCARDGGLVSYGVDLVDDFRCAASYVDRILRGAKPAELSVQLPTKYELVINLKTAKALGLTIPETLLATADEVIQ